MDIHALSGCGYPCYRAGGQLCYSTIDIAMYETKCIFDVILPALFFIW